MKREEDCIMNYGILAKSVLVPVVGSSLVDIRHKEFKRNL
jgi:hypothetical protein